MTCLDCQKELSYLDHRESLERLNLELCPAHRARMEKLMRTHKTPIEAIQLYYGLKKSGTRAMLAWWDGKKTVDLAVSRVKLNIEIDRGHGAMTHDQAMNDLEETMHSFKNGFTHIRIPDFLVQKYYRETLSNIEGIIEGLKNNIKVV
ncbi:hypothetical protein [Robiginitalea sp. SC105]|uniref:hypothetical protein n=1 Tax=Robiginitalea sp. SC105 TaxID=2762332 RepID=UPI00163A1F1C|nr:hypothetical protein [Robiginitalea sp. SC105]MBC2840452.1 hypothetical protein [Robiginitalea sp. SC105]